MTWRDPEHGPLIVSAGLVLGAYGLALWFRFRQLTHPNGKVKCPHCSMRYDNTEE